jgi:hypothetical protein
VLHLTLPKISSHLQSFYWTITQQMFVEDYADILFGNLPIQDAFRVNQHISTRAARAKTTSGRDGDLVETLSLLKLIEEFVQHVAAALFGARAAWMTGRTCLTANKDMF